MNMDTDNHPEIYLKPTWYIDSDSKEIIEYSQNATKNKPTDVAKAIALYYSVRDDIYYDPYNYELTCESLKASSILKKKSGYCVAKAVVLAASARSVKIPARLRFADVRNHLTTKRLSEMMETDIFVYHGYTELFLEGKWIKATPTFNKSLCEKFNINPLEFDGKTDSIFHQFDTKGKKHMEYLKDHGHYADLPIDEIITASLKAYPNFLKNMDKLNSDDFENEANPI